MRKVYLLSEEFDYSNTISSAYGPVYACRMGWSTDSIRNISKHSELVTIVDNRITERECSLIEQYLQCHPSHIVLFKVADPSARYYRGHWYYQLLFRVKGFPNAFFLSNYIPADLVKELDDSTENEKMMFVPYPFFEDRQHLFDAGDRINKIIFSGSVEEEVYPYRYQFRRQTRWSLRFRWRVSFLEHPGYPDIGQAKKHSIIGEAYVAYLARYRFMFLSPSRYGLELLKYSECAAARCVPVGKAPLSFSEEMREPFIEIDFKEIATGLKMVFAMPETELSDRSASYYEAIQRRRNPELLNKQLDTFLQRI